MPGLARQVKDLALPQAVAQVADAALNRPLAQELPYAIGAALKKKKIKRALEENTGGYLRDLGLSKDFLNMIQKLLTIRKI